MEDTQWAMWLLCVLVGGPQVSKFVGWAKNGRNNKTSSQKAPACPMGLRVDPEDTPRKHTDLLRQILAELKGMRREMRSVEP